MEELTGAAVDAVAKRSTGGDVSMLFAGVVLGDVTVVAGEDLLRGEGAPDLGGRKRELR